MLENIQIDTKINQIEWLQAKLCKQSTKLAAVSGENWPPSWIFKCSFIWIWRLPQNIFFVPISSVAVINYLYKYTCEYGIFYFGDLYDLENDIET